MAAVELMVIDVETSCERDAIEQALHVGERRNGHADPAHFAGRQGMVGIQPHLRRQVESHREPGGALGQQIPIAAVAFFRSAETGILAHRPQPASVHVGVDAASVGEFARVGQSRRS